MNLLFAPQAWEDYHYWQNGDKKTLKRVNRLIEEARRSPFEGIGKPEPLKGDKRGYWSRRITDEHRFVYKAEGDTLKIAQLRFHY